MKGGLQPVTAVAEKLNTQDSEREAARLADDKEALTNDLARAKAHRVHLEHTVRLKTQAVEDSEKKWDGARKEVQELTTRSKTEAAESAKLLLEAQEKVAAQKAKTMVSNQSRHTAKLD